MKKEEYIRRYGEERYNEFKKQVIAIQKKRAEEKRAANPKIRVDKTAVKDEITVRMLIQVPDYEYYEDFTKWLKKYESAFQRKLREEWKRLSNQRHIIVVDCWSHAVSNKTFTVSASLTQLGMRKKERDSFKQIVKEIADDKELF